MSNKAVRYLSKSKGWESGVGPTVVVDKGVAKNPSASTPKDEADALIFDQTGFMAVSASRGRRSLRSNSVAN